MKPFNREGIGSLCEVCDRDSQSFLGLIQWQNKSSRFLQKKFMTMLLFSVGFVDRSKIILNQLKVSEYNLIYADRAILAPPC